MGRANMLKSAYMRKSYNLYLLPWVFGLTFAYFYWPEPVRTGKIDEEKIKISHPGLMEKVRRDHREHERVDMMVDILNRAATPGEDPFDNEHWKRPNRPMKKEKPDE